MNDIRTIVRLNIQDNIERMYKVRNLLENIADYFGLAWILLIAVFGTFLFMLALLASCA